VIRFSRSITEIHAELSSFCHLKCPQCPRTIGESPNPYLQEAHLSLSKLREILPFEDIRDLKLFFACGNYGDPLMNPECLEIYRYLRTCSRNLELQLHTNGSLRNKTFFYHLAQTLQDKGSVIFSIDGLEDTNHIYRRGSVWNKIINNANSFIKAGGYAIWNYIVFEHNEHQIDEARQLAREIGFKAFNVKYSKRRVHPTTSWLKPVRKPLEVSRGPIVICQALAKQSLYIDAHGDLYPCCYVGEAHYHPRYIEGYKDIDNETLNSYPFNPTSSICVKSCTVNNKGLNPTEAQFSKNIVLD